MSAVKGFLLDITGVLYDSISGSDGVPIPKSAEAVQLLYKQNNVKFLSNTKGKTNEDVAKRLGRLGINVRPEDIITPAPIVAQYCRDNNLRPYLFVRKEVMNYFADINTDNPNCVVMGEVEDGYTFQRMNTAFRLLLSMKNPLLITMGNGKFFQRTDGPCLDVGVFAAGLRFATNCEHINIGKPNPAYFAHGIRALGFQPEEVVMIGDDTLSDVGGAQACGMRAVQVKTGKWRPECEQLNVTPDLSTNCLYDAVEMIANNGFRL